MRKLILTSAIAVALAAGVPHSLWAGTYTNDFTTDPATTGHTLSGSALWNSTGGNPGPFVQLTDAFQEVRGAILLPDFDSGTPIKGFTVTMDVMVGGGSDMPGEGWSINFVPETAEVIANGAAGPGWASDFVPTPNLPERGSVSGLGVYALTYDHGGGDILGFNVRYNQTQFVVAGWTLPPTGPKHLNGECADVYSLQTGTNTSGVAGLCWAKFSMTMREGGFLDIYWKGAPVVTNFPTPWTAQSGRWILGARTSIEWYEAHQFDNIGITTVAADKPQVTGFFGFAGGFTYTIADYPGATLDPASVRLTLDGASVTATSISKVSTNTTISYTTVLSAASHQASVTFSSLAGASSSATNNFTVAPYVTIPASYAVTGVNTSQRGFRVRPYQTTAAQPNNLAWTENQLAGLYGPNTADLGAADPQGFISNPGVVSYDLDVGALNGHFNAPDYPVASVPGIPGIWGSTGNFAEEIITWLHFPAAGAYLMGVNSDDGFKVSTSQIGVRDPNGLVLGQFNGGRGAQDTMFAFVVEQSGYYPFRLIWENGNGEFSAGNAANCEWFTQLPNGTLVLINDLSNPGSIRAYSSGPLGLPVVQSFSSGFVGFTYQVLNGTTAVATNTIQTTLNGAPVSPTITVAGGLTTVNYTQPQPLPSPSVNEVTLAFADNGTTPVTQRVTNTFSVTGQIVPASFALQTGVDPLNPGFAVRTYQTTYLDNRVWAMERQLAGLNGPNIADMNAGPGGLPAVNGWWTNSSVISYDISAGPNGHFLSSAFPGLPGTTGSTDYPAMEILTWVYFPSAGGYTMGVNSDDGFKVSIGANPRDQFAPILGLFDNGRGASDTIFQFYIPTAGYYPLRLIWENGAGGCNLEWFSVLPSGELVLINDMVASSLQAYASGPLATPAYVSLLNPAVDQLNTDPLSEFYVQFTDGSTQIDSAFVTAAVNGTAVPGLTVNKVGGITTAQALMPFLPSGSTNTATLTYREVGASTTVTQTWQFVMATFQTVPVGLSSPLGSGVATKPGFRVGVAQLPIGFNNSTLNAFADAIEQVLAGLWGTGQALSSSNVANLALFTDNGYYDLTGVVNFSGNNGGAELGNFQTSNGYPDAANPGIPGTTGSESQFATEFITYLEFPRAGFYRMGVSSDDCFRVYPTDQRPTFIGSTLHINAPAAIAGRRLPGDPAWNTGGWGGNTPPWPRPPITGKVVYAVPNVACGTLSNPAEIAGNIAMCDRGACEFGTKALECERAGAIACIIVNNRQDLPISMGAGAVGAQVTIPVMMLHQNDGEILKTNLTQPGGVWVTVGQDTQMIAGEYNNQGGRGTGDTWFHFGIPQPGVYPFRLAYNQGGGGYSCEWFTVESNGARTLVNAPVAGALKAYRERIVSTPPALSIRLLGNQVEVTFEGILSSATSPTGQFTDLPSATSPYLVPASGGAMYFRSHR